ncbi:cytochrome C oxidase subunit IV family protein [Laceyella sacchari]|jgi:cytochrome c oxidase subunit IV|uniref:Cytochrome C oxidase subunit IV family protein n=1 Tax=Laceyella sacchari TaxID=37482 RepID=A0ABY5U319_LACSH|nr:cytochrome C oxidase subunit IV family protein [Laceyella sacchari]TCW39290.1 cytochrome c oxidase subunit 4 [Laceyella sacchari]UWE03589.1 cytochrome C oxidase subunit IV family protein [Laceyella sacchari]
MEPQLQQQTQRPVKPKEKPETAWRYVLSFIWMILFTAIAFVVVGGGLVESKTAIFWVLIISASIQVVLQLFTFMHLDQKGYGIVIVFMGVGLVIAVVSAVGMVLM